jgi:hypothetical protein
MVTSQTVTSAVFTTINREVSATSRKLTGSWQSIAKAVQDQLMEIRLRAMFCSVAMREIQRWPFGVSFETLRIEAGLPGVGS